MFKGASYTIELRRIDPVFDFKYDFYEPALKCNFERKFIDHYYFNEIGFETVGRFKQRLKALLNKKMPYYTQLYKTELEAQEINFLLNKDLKETFIRELDRTDNMTGSNTTNTQDSIHRTGTDIKDNSEQMNATITGDNTQTTNSTVDNTQTTNSTGDNTQSTTGKNTINEKKSNIADGVASAELSGGYLTGVAENVNEGTNKVVTTDKGTNEVVTKDKGTNEVVTVDRGTNETTNKGREVGVNESTTQNAGSAVGSNKEDRTGKEQERTELISQGNIGITSSAELLEKWRSVLINIDEMIIEECQDLFMGIF